MRPTHSILSLPIDDLHFSRLGIGGQPYIGSTRGAIRQYKGDEQQFYHTTTKPSELGTDTWYKQAVADNPLYAATLSTNFERGRWIMRNLGSMIAAR